MRTCSVVVQWDDWWTESVCDSSSWYTLHCFILCINTCVQFTLPAWIIGPHLVIRAAAISQLYYTHKVMDWSWHMHCVQVFTQTYLLLCHYVNKSVWFKLWNILQFQFCFSLVYSFPFSVIFLVSVNRIKIFPLTDISVFVSVHLFLSKIEGLSNARSHDW